MGYGTSILIGLLCVAAVVSAILYVWIFRGQAPENSAAIAAGGSDRVTA